MITHRFLMASLAAAGLLSAMPVLAQSVVVTGSDGRNQTMDRAQIAALPRVTAPLDIHGAAHVFEGPLLIDVLKAAGVVGEGPLRGPALAQAVVVRATDGYAVVFGLAEIDPATRADAILLADAVDGAAIPDADGPWRLVAQGDLRPARSARQVTTIEIINLANPGAGDHEAVAPRP